VQAEIPPAARAVLRHPAREGALMAAASSRITSNPWSPAASASIRFIWTRENPASAKQPPGLPSSSRLNGQDSEQVAWIEASVVETNGRSARGRRSKMCLPARTHFSGGSLSTSTPGELPVAGDRVEARSAHG
jgi:hypothetical protein